jgi:HEAT repeat protein
MTMKNIVSAILVLVVVHPALSAEYDPVIDSPMYRDPDLPVPELVLRFPEAAKALWLRALERPEVEMRRQAAEAVALARRRGATGLESMAGPLIAVLDRPEQPLVVRIAATDALIALDARSAAPSLFRQVSTGNADLCHRIEPTLAGWNYEPMRALWLERLGDRGTPPRSLVLAMRGLATVKEAKAEGPIRELVRTPGTPAPLRLEAAQALGQLRTAGLEKDAEPLAADATPAGLVARLAAVALLHQHKSEAAARLLQTLARDPQPTVSSAAVGRLLAIDPALAVPALDHLLASPDAGLRLHAVAVLFRQPTARPFSALADRLDDEHIDVRRQARQSLQQLGARKEFRGPILEQGMRLLAGTSWRGQEQAAILLAQLDHKPAATRLLELLPSRRGEVMIAAAWALRQLAVPDTLPEVTEYIGARTGWARGKRDLPPLQSLPPDMVSHQMSQLMQLLGRLKYQPAESLLRRFVPRSAMSQGPEARAAAVWALGRLLEGKPDAALAPALVERLNDTTSIPPEDNRVRRMAAVTLGRMKARDQLPSLKAYLEELKPTNDLVVNACGWSICQISGTTWPAPEKIARPRLDWFLVPGR